MRRRLLTRMPIRIACRSCNTALLEWAIFTPSLLRLNSYCERVHESIRIQLKLV